MSEAKALFDVLRQSADGQSVAAIERLVHDGTDRDLCRINVLAFAQKAGLNEERAIAAFGEAAARFEELGRPLDRRRQLQLLVVVTFAVAN